MNKRTPDNQHLTSLTWVHLSSSSYPDQLHALIIALRAETEATKVTELASQFRQVLGLLEEAFVECGKAKGFFGGDAVGYLDITLGSGLGWIMAVEKGKSVKLLDAEELPRLAG
ncbi:hypothetical protein ZIOFF_014225 [Zingiber officinale]|uniref:GST C-terminal domain-containing protein n=1 Tax=Zingiber officinale TaxID=94328 RepID=A0A8J5HPT6_ZINOF|nr:hypothetical protein ZIOFF_014225 [Zingiber officinale]